MTAELPKEILSSTNGRILAGLLFESLPNRSVELFEIPSLG
jgi:hypothetical protein